MLEIEELGKKMGCSKALAVLGLLLLAVCPLIFSKASARELLHKTQGGEESSSKGNIGEGPAKPEYYYYGPYYPPSGPSYSPPSPYYSLPSPFSYVPVAPPHPQPSPSCSAPYYCDPQMPPTTYKSNDRHN